jgi:hypothetical protein
MSLKTIFVFFFVFGNKELVQCGKRMFNKNLVLGDKIQNQACSMPQGK